MKLPSTAHVVMDSILLEEPSSSTASSDGGGGSRAIDRHNPIIRDEKRLGQGRIFPSSVTIAPHLCNEKPEVEGGDQKRKSVAFANDGETLKASGFISPASSSRCLLNDITMSHVPSPSPPPPPSPPHKHLNVHNGKAFKKKDDAIVSSPPPPPIPQPPPSSTPIPCDGFKQLQSPLHEHHDSLSSATTKPPSPPHPPPSSSQVVVLEVALHCRGCERKMKKHISKIEGVTSFKIEFAAKKVTVVGDVTPLAVLTSVLKVKNAKLLAPATISSAQSGSNGS
ncbi:putative heavy metal-associated domain, HMA, heavy metal-associated domain superfamily [Helianthus annuus]|nr:putative heavy metal-associated domain, HMA, heavy metal-associated domain superfamily [Helianthus annuus]